MMAHSPAALQTEFSGRQNVSHWLEMDPVRQTTHLALLGHRIHTLCLTIPASDDSCSSKPASQASSASSSSSSSSASSLPSPAEFQQAIQTLAQSCPNIKCIELTVRLPLANNKSRLPKVVLFWQRSPQVPNHHQLQSYLMLLPPPTTSTSTFSSTSSSPAASTFSSTSLHSTSPADAVSLVLDGPQKKPKKGGLFAFHTSTSSSSPTTTTLSPGLDTLSLPANVSSLSISCSSRITSSRVFCQEILHMLSAHPALKAVHLSDLSFEDGEANGSSRADRATPLTSTASCFSSSPPAATDRSLPSKLTFYLSALWTGLIQKTMMAGGTNHTRNSNNSSNNKPTPISSASSSSSSSPNHSKVSTASNGLAKNNNKRNSIDYDSDNKSVDLDLHATTAQTAEEKQAKVMATATAISSGCCRDKVGVNCNCNLRGQAALGLSAPALSSCPIASTTTPIPSTSKPTPMPTIAMGGSGSLLLPPAYHSLSTATTPPTEKEQGQSDLALVRLDTIESTTAANATATSSLALVQPPTTMTTTTTATATTTPLSFVPLPQYSHPYLEHQHHQLLTLTLHKVVISSRQLLLLGIECPGLEHFESYESRGSATLSTWTSLLQTWKGLRTFKLHHYQHQQDESKKKDQGGNQPSTEPQQQQPRPQQRQLLSGQQPSSSSHRKSLSVGSTFLRFGSKNKQSQSQEPSQQPMATTTTTSSTFSQPLNTSTTTTTTTTATASLDALVLFRHCPPTIETLEVIQPILQVFYSSEPPMAADAAAASATTAVTFADAKQQQQPTATTPTTIPTTLSSSFSSTTTSSANIPTKSNLSRIVFLGQHPYPLTTLDHVLAHCPRLEYLEFGLEPVTAVSNMTRTIPTTTTTTTTTATTTTTSRSNKRFSMPIVSSNNNNNSSSSSSSTGGIEIVFPSTNLDQQSDLFEQIYPSLQTLQQVHLSQQPIPNTLQYPFFAKLMARFRQAPKLKVLGLSVSRLMMADGYFHQYHHQPLTTRVKEGRLLLRAFSVNVERDEKASFSAGLETFELNCDQTAKIQPGNVMDWEILMPGLKTIRLLPKSRTKEGVFDEEARKVLDQNNVQVVSG